MQTIPLKRWMVGAALVAAGALAVGCGDDDGAGSGGSGGAGTGGDGGSAGTAGTGGTGGTAGMAGTGGSAGTAGTGGTGGDAGSAGTAGGGEPCDPTAEAAVEVDGNITADTTWECGTYLLQDIIYVTNNATLTIEPGVRVLGDIDAPTITALISTRGSKLNAVGTEEEPIVFSSSADDGDRLPGDWGGVVLLGNATINSPVCVGGDENNGCAGGHYENTIEGLNPELETSKYGGTDDAWNCGHLEYVRIEFAGFELAPNVELNSLSVGGCGTGTTLSHIQAHHGSDDGIEMFGGTAGLDHIVLSQSSDDGLDWDLGWRGKVQFLVIHQTQNGNDGDKGIEADNLGAQEDALPRSKPVIYNATMIGNAGKTGMLLREGTQGELRNFLVQGFAIGVDLNALMTMGTDFTVEWPTNLSIEDSCFFNVAEIGDADATDDDKGFNENDAITNAARGNVTNVDPMLGSTDNSEPDYLPASTALGDKATPPAGFDTTANYCGAFAEGGEDWSAGWTAFPEG